MSSLLYFGAILLGLVIHNASAQSSIIMSTVQPLSGELCPGSVTFTCNSLNSGSSIIDFFYDDDRLVRYEFDFEHTFPRNVTPVPSGFMAQLTSAEFSTANRKFSYINFTLSADLNYLMFYEGKNVSCGDVALRSNSISIDNYTIKDLALFSSELLNIRFSMIYVGLQLKPTEIIVVWDDLTFSDDCIRSISYNVELTHQDLKQNTGYNCSNMTCSATFLLGNERKESDIFNISVTGSSDTQNFSSGRIPFNTSIASILTIHTDTDCKLRIVCPSNNNDKCVVKYRESESSQFESFEVDQERAINVSPGKLVYLNITKQMSSNLTYIAQINYTADNPLDNYDVYVGVGVTFMILGVIFEIVGCAIIVFHLNINCKIKSCIDHKLLMWIHGMSWLLVVLSFSLWILYGIVNDSGSCTSGRKGDIAIAAAAMSLFLIVVSVAITGALILDCIPGYKKSKSPVVEEISNKVSYDKKYKLKFGIEYTTMESDSTKKDKKLCKCGAKFGDVQYFKDLPSAMFGDTVRRNKCRACPKNTCSNCLRSAFRKQTLEWVNVCGDCYIKYKSEKEIILKYPKLGWYEPIKQEYSDICYECKSAEKKQKVNNCKGCGQWVCDSCIIKKEPVHLQYSNIYEHVCRNCYALIKIMQGNPNSKNKEVVEVNDDVAGETLPENLQGNLKSENNEDLAEEKGKLTSEIQFKVVQGNLKPCNNDNETKERSGESLDTKL